MIAKTCAPENGVKPFAIMEIGSGANSVIALADGGAGEPPAGRGRGGMA
jgi:hypothetical protein